MLYNFNLFNNLQKVKSPHYWVGLTSLPGGRLAGTGRKARPACYVSGSGTNSVQCAMLYPIGLYYQTLPILLQPILADNNFNRNFHSVTRKNNRHDRNRKLKLCVWYAGWLLNQQFGHSANTTVE